MLNNVHKTWLVTGCAGFIGSHILETLLKGGQRVIGLDNFSTGSKGNLEQVKKIAGPAWSQFTFVEGDIRKSSDVKKAFEVEKIDLVLHQAALGSVTRSLVDPQATHDNNVNGFLNVLLESKNQKIQKLVYASSSSVYGDHPDLPKKEENIGKPLSPYALSKSINEQYAAVYFKSFGVPSMGLRYFNVFGPRQDATGPYAAVIPLWVNQMMGGHPVVINGDGLTSRDFCYVQNAVQANIKGALSENPETFGKVYNVALGERTTLLELFEIIKNLLKKDIQPTFKDFRAGDVRHSLANIDRAKKDFNYVPEIFVKQGLEASIEWYKCSV